MAVNQEIFNAYAKAINKIEDQSEYMHFRPHWLTKILKELESDLRTINTNARNTNS